MNTEIKIGDILRIEELYSRNHYEFYKVLKITKKTLKIIQIKTKREKKEDFTDFYGLYIVTCIDEVLFTGNHPTGRVRIIKKTEIEENMINNLNYEFELYP